MVTSGVQSKAVSDWLITSVEVRASPACRARPPEGGPRPLRRRRSCLDVQGSAADGPGRSASPAPPRVSACSRRSPTVGQPRPSGAERGGLRPWRLRRELASPPVRSGPAVCGRQRRARCDRPLQFLPHFQGTPGTPRLRPAAERRGSEEQTRAPGERAALPRPGRGARAGAGPGRGQAAAASELAVQGPGGRCSELHGGAREFGQRTPTLTGQALARLPGVRVGVSCRWASFLGLQQAEPPRVFRALCRAGPVAACHPLPWPLAPEVSVLP